MIATSQLEVIPLNDRSLFYRAAAAACRETGRPTAADELAAMAAHAESPSQMAPTEVTFDRSSGELTFSISCPDCGEDFVGAIILPVHEWQSLIGHPLCTFWYNHGPKILLTLIPWFLLLIMVIICRLLP